MRSYRKKQTLILILLLIAVFGISIGFAAFSSTLNITPEVGVTPNAADFSVKFSTTQDSLTVGEVEPYSMTDGVTATNAMIDNSGIPTISNMSAVYTGPGDYVTYRFYVRNDGEYLAYLNSITFNGGKTCSEKKGTTTSSANDACNDIIMTVKVGEVSVTETTLNILDETLNPGESKIVEVTVQYSENGYIPDGDFSLEFGTVSLYYASTGGINEENSGDSGSTQVYKPQYYSFLTGGNYTEDLPSDAKTTVAELNPGHPLYIGLDVDSNNKVTAEYICFVRNETEYCLKGHDNEPFTTNTNIIKDAFSDVVDTEACSFDDGSSYCNAGGLVVYVEDNGQVDANDGSAYCGVTSGGSFGCSE